MPAATAAGLPVLSYLFCLRACVLYLIAAFWQAPHASRGDVLTFAAAGRVCFAAHVFRSTSVPQQSTYSLREIVMADNTVRGRFVWHELMTPDTSGAHAF